MYEATLTTKVTLEQLDLITKVSRDRGEGRSSLVRRAILKELACLGYLPPDQRKSLGLTTLEASS